MRRRSVLGVAFWLACACDTGQPGTPPQPSTSEPVGSAHIREAPPDLTRAAMLALANDRLLFWTDSWARVRSNDGTFGPSLRLPHGTHRLAVFGERILAAGFQREQAGPDEALVVLMDTTGKELGRWPLAQRVADVLLDGRGARVLTALGSIALEPAVGSPEPYGPGMPLPLGTAARPYVFEHAGASVSCLSTTPTKRYDIAPHCERTGEHGYRFVARLREPVACGPWLAFAAGDELVVHSLAQGDQVARAPLANVTALACEGDTHLLVAAGGLERRSLPSLSPTVRLELPKDQTVRDMAVLERGVAYRVNERPNVVSFMPRAR